VRVEQKRIARILIQEKGVKNDRVETKKELQIFIFQEMGLTNDWVEKIAPPKKK